MTSGSRRGVTRGYVGGLILATLIVAVALVVACWGGLALFLDQEPVATSGVPRLAAPLIVAVALAGLAWTLWRQALTLLRGERAPAWGRNLLNAVFAYLLWCVGGLATGMSIGDTWMSPFAVTLAAIWTVTSVLFWAVLTRRVYTDRGVPKWPWEKREEREQRAEQEAEREADGDESGSASSSGAGPWINPNPWHGPAPWEEPRSDGNTNPGDDSGGEPGRGG